MCLRLMICLMMIAIAAGPMANKGFCQDDPAKYGNHQITSVPPKVLASAEEQLPKAKKNTGKYLLLAAVGVALVALAAGGGGGDKSAPATDSGSVGVGW